MKTPKSKTSYKKYLRHAYINSLQLNPVTEEEIKKKNSEKEVIGPHSTSTHVLKELNNLFQYLSSSLKIFFTRQKFFQSSVKSHMLHQSSKKVLRKQCIPDYISF